MRFPNRAASLARLLAAAIDKIVAALSQQFAVLHSCWTGALLVAGLSMAGPGQTKTIDREAIVVWGRSVDLVGIAHAGSEGVVGYRDLEKRPLLRVGELVETVPGVIATQHSGTGKANQYFLRGFNLDHGTDFAGFVDGVPVNMRSHGHGQGYLDYNFLIPELVERVDYRKGPYYADAGDFASAGTISFSTYDRLKRPLVELTIGSFDYYRALAAGSAAAGNGDLLAAVEANVSNGHWQRNEDLQKFNSLLKYTQGAEDQRWSVTLSAYNARWNSTDQIPLRATQSGLISRRGFIDPDLGGNTTRIALSADAELGRTSISAYALHYNLRLTSNFTYFLNDPVNGDEFQQRDRRWIFGGTLRHGWTTDIAGLPVDMKIGSDGRYDRIGKVGLYTSIDGRRSSIVREDAVDEYSLGAYVEAEIALTRRLRTIFGLRGDVYGYDVNANIAQNSGNGSDAILTPKLTLAWKADDHLEFYVNYGEGFHSNDVRGAAITVDPVARDPAEKVDVLIRTRGAELGVRVDHERFNASLVGFWLHSASELVFVGDAGTTEPNDASRRFGLEFNSFWQPVEAVTLDLSAAWTKARFANVPNAIDRIPGSVGAVMGAGASIDFGSGFTGSLRLRHFGKAPLIQDGSVKSRSTTLVNFGGYYTAGKLRLGADLYNLFNAKDADITYFYESRLQSEPAAREDIHYHPVEPRQLRISLRYSF